jgi:hypothetical protein
MVVFYLNGADAEHLPEQRDQCRLKTNPVAFRGNALSAFDNEGKSRRGASRWIRALFLSRPLLMTLVNEETSNTLPQPGHDAWMREE